MKIGRPHTRSSRRAWCASSWASPTTTGTHAGSDRSHDAAADSTGANRRTNAARPAAAPGASNDWAISTAARAFRKPAPCASGVNARFGSQRGFGAIAIVLMLVLLAAISSAFVRLASAQQIGSAQ